METVGDRAARTHYKCHVTITETMMLRRKCKSFDCSKIHENCFSIVFGFHDDIDYEMLNRGMFQKNVGSLCLCCFRALFMIVRPTK